MDQVEKGGNRLLWLSGRLVPGQEERAEKAGRGSYVFNSNVVPGPWSSLLPP